MSRCVSGDLKTVFKLHSLHRKQVPIIIKTVYVVHILKNTTGWYSVHRLDFYQINIYLKNPVSVKLE